MPGGRRAVVCCLSPVPNITQVWDVARTKSIYISIASLQKLKEPGKYEYFFKVYHNNEIYRP